MARERFGEDACEGAEDIGLGGGKERELEGEAQDVLANGHGGDHGVDQVRRLGRHTSPGAARTEAAALTTEGHEQIVLTRFALQMHEAL